MLNVAPNVIYVVVSGSQLSRAIKTSTEFCVAVVKAVLNSYVDPFVAKHFSRLGRPLDALVLSKVRVVMLLLLMQVNVIMVPTVSVLLLNSRCLYYWWHARSSSTISVYQYHCTNGAYLTLGACIDARYTWRRITYTSLIQAAPFSWDPTCPDTVVDVYSPLYMAFLLEIGIIFPALELLLRSQPLAPIIDWIGRTAGRGLRASSELDESKDYAQIINVLALIVTFGLANPLLAVVGFVSAAGFRYLQLRHVRDSSSSSILSVPFDCACVVLLVHLFFCTLFFSNKHVHLSVAHDVFGLLGLLVVVKCARGHKAREGVGGALTKALVSTADDQGEGASDVECKEASIRRYGVAFHEHCCRDQGGVDVEDVDLDEEGEDGEDEDLDEEGEDGEVSPW
jgi:hypothetical protein